MSRRILYSIKPEEAGERAEFFLRSHGCSHHILTLLKRQPDGILLNGQRCFASAQLKAGDQLVINLPAEEPSPGVLPVKMDLKIVFEDEDLMVIDKPADMPVHPSANNHDNTIANGLAWYFQAKGQPCVCRCIHRLDRDTTGLFIAAKNVLSASLLSEMLIRREIHREYLALAEGLTPEEGCIDAPIGRLPGSVLARCVDFSGGDRAVTHYRRLNYQNGYSLVSIRLETGRTHQIRVHMSYIGHPLPGDFLYNPNYSRIHRQALHSHRLTFCQPITGEPLDFISALPDDMLRAMNTEDENQTRTT